MTQVSALSSFRYRAFISYSHRDKAWARWLHKALETYAIPKRLVGQPTSVGRIPRRLVSIFRDREELASATDLGRTINEALAQSANLIVICSPPSATSRWVSEEVPAFKRLGRGERVFCLVVDGEPHASELARRGSEECFASALRYQIGDDGSLSTLRAKPIAADARAGKDGRTCAPRDKELLVRAGKRPDCRQPMLLESCMQLSGNGCPAVAFLQTPPVPNRWKLP